MHKKEEKLTLSVILRKFRTLTRILIARLRRFASFLKALPRHARKVRQIIRREGWSGLWYTFEERFHLADRELYEIWQRRHRLTAEDRDRIRAQVEKMARPPLISVLLPVYNTDEAWLRKCLDSVLSQIYPHWELCIADDASTLPHVRPVLDGAKQVRRSKRVVDDDRDSVFMRNRRNRVQVENVRIRVAERF